RCVGAAAPSSKVVLARQLTQPPTVTFTCSSGAVIDCGTSVVPDIVTMSLSAVDPNSRSGTAYTATLTGERRQT
ncbi:MAG: hypothetical protein JWO46_2297, partial [Nocardioidaceae bacterium]|nr:hypothetical protein [Nocardioidaceae bacterium]